MTSRQATNLRPAPSRAAPTPGPARALAPSTGDPAIDAALAALDAVAGEPLAQHIVAGERVHQVLQARLSDLGGA